MKQLLGALCLIHCLSSAMQDQSNQIDASVQTIEQKKRFLKKLLSPDDITRTVTLAAIKGRCKSLNTWPQTESEIVIIVKYIDTFVQFSMHPALRILKRRKYQIQYQIHDYDALELKQDLICICRPLLKNAPGYQLWQKVQDISAVEVNCARNKLWKILEELEFKD